MECKCPELKEFEFILNLDIEKLHNIQLVGLKNGNENLIKVGSNIWISESVSQEVYILEWLALFENIINEIKSELCPCLQNKIDTVKFVIVDSSTNDYIQNSPAILQAWVNPGFNIININFGQFYWLLEDPSRSYNSLKETVYHELIHIFESCPPCRDEKIIKQVNDKIDELSREYNNFIKEIKEFTRNFTENIIKNLPDSGSSFCESELIKYIKTYGIDFLDMYDFDYAYTNAHEFLASMSEQLCSTSLGVFNPRLVRDFESINDNCKDYVVNKFLDYKTQYLIDFNKRFRDLQIRLCSIWNELYSSSDNCNESFTNNTYEISFYSTGRDKNYCATKYLVEIRPKNTGCCKQVSDDITGSMFRIGEITRQNECDCDFLWNRIEYDADTLLDNCRGPFGEQQYLKGDIINLIIDIENQVISAINNKYTGKIKIIRDLSEKSTPCSK